MDKDLLATPLFHNRGVPREELPSTDDTLGWIDLLLTHPAISTQYILEVADGVWECRCGNTSEFEGFDTCDEFGIVVEPVLGPWDGSLHLCGRCNRIINGDTLEVLAYASQEVAEVNEDYR